MLSLNFLKIIFFKELKVLWHFLDFIISEAESKLYFINSHHVCSSRGDQKVIILASHMKKKKKTRWVKLHSARHWGIKRTTRTRNQPIRRREEGKKERLLVAEFGYEMGDRAYIGLVVRELLEEERVWSSRKSLSDDHNSVCQAQAVKPFLRIRY